VDAHISKSSRGADARLRRNLLSKVVVGSGWWKRKGERMEKKWKRGRKSECPARRRRAAARVYEEQSGAAAARERGRELGMGKMGLGLGFDAKRHPLIPPIGADGRPMEIGPSGALGT
jgi:hypothetical protein